MPMTSGARRRPPVPPICALVTVSVVPFVMILGSTGWGWREDDGSMAIRLERTERRHDFTPTAFAIARSQGRARLRWHRQVTWVQHSEATGRAPAGLGPVVGPVLGFGLAGGRIARCGAAALARRGSNTTVRRSFCEMPGRAAEARKKPAEILRGSGPSFTFLSPGGRTSETRSASDQQRLHGCRRRGCSQCLAATPVRSHGAERRCQRRYCPLFFQRLFHQRLRRVSSPHDPAIGSASVR